MINWKTSKEDNDTIGEIVERAMGVARKAGIADRVDRQGLMMDITAAHANGCPIRLADLLAADAFTFSHDVFGISRHIDRETGKLGGCFVPRMAVREAVAR